MNQPLVSVIIPVYNAEKYIRESISSIVNQTYKNLEIIVIDDKSSDNSIKLVEEFIDNRIVLIKNDVNLKQPKTRNKGLKIAKGKYIANMDSDDISDLHRIEKQVAYMERNLDVDICGGYAKLFGDVNNERVFKRPIEDEDIRIEAITGCPLIHPTVMLRASSIDKFQIQYDPNFKYAQDYELWSRLAFKNAKFHNIPEILLYYRVSNQQISRAYKGEQTDYANTITQRNLDTLFGRNLNFNVFTKVEITLEDLEEDLKKISSMRNKLYNNMNADKVIGHIIDTLVSSKTYLGLGVFVKYLKCQKRYNLFRLWTVKFLVKCIIRHNNT